MRLAMRKMMPAVPANAARIASDSYMSTTKTTPAEVARYGYRMMKPGKPAADHNSQITVHRFSSCSRPDHTGLCFAEINALVEHPRLGRAAATRRKRITGMKEKLVESSRAGMRRH